MLAADERGAARRAALPRGDAGETSVMVQNSLPIETHHSDIAAQSHIRSQQTPELSKARPVALMQCTMPLFKIVEKRDKSIDVVKLHLS